MIQDFCSKLKEKRAELGYTIEEVVDKTKLHPSVIRDLEGGNLENINPTYIRGFIKIYASFLGVPLGGVLEQIPKPTVKVKTKKEEKDIVRKRRLPFKRDIPPKVKKAIIPFILGLAILLILIIVSRAISRRSSQSREETIKKEERSTVSTPKEAFEGVSVSLTVQRNCFLRVKADGKLVFEGALRKGTVESWEAKEELDFRISDGSAVYIEVNGKPLPRLTTMRKTIKSLKITPSGISVEK